MHPGLRDFFPFEIREEGGLEKLEERVDWKMDNLTLRVELDEFFIYDDEICACMRTLGRRRVNNPCLMGEPGVDNAEDIAQILAAPTLLKKGDNISKRDNDGQFIDKERFKNWGYWRR